MVLRAGRVSLYKLSDLLAAFVSCKVSVFPSGLWLQVATSHLGTNQQQHCMHTRANLGLRDGCPSRAHLFLNWGVRTIARRENT